MIAPVAAECPWLVEQARRRPNALALVDDQGPLSYAQLNAAADLLARALLASGIGAADIVALDLPPAREFVAALFALQRIGATAAPLARRASASERNAQIARLKPKLLLALGDAGGADVSWPPTASLAGLVARDPPPARLPQYIDPDAALTILFTSGSAAAPKAVVLTNGNHHASAVATMTRLDVSIDDRWLCCMPLWHAGGLGILFRAVVWGFSACLHRRFDEVEIAGAFASGEITSVSLVPTMLARLCRRLDGSAARGRLRVALIGGAEVAPALARDALARGFPLRRTYGLTETASAVTMTDTWDAGTDPTSSGRPLEGVAVRIDDADGRGVGEILLRGPQVMRGYLGDPEATDNVLGDGWLRTADLGCIGARGALHVTGRRDDVIVSGGENVSPAEVEAVLLSHPAVAEAAVVGVPDDTWGRVVAAAVVRRFGFDAEADTLARWCRPHLAGFKVPRRWLFVSALPRTASGKIRRKDLTRVFSG